MKRNGKVTTLTAAIAVAVSFGVAAPTSATSVIGSTEPTQIANNIELVASYMEQVKQAIYQVRQYKAQLEALRQMDPAKLDDMLKGVAGVESGADVLQALGEANEINGELRSLAENMQTIYKEGRIAADVIEMMNASGHKITPDDYIGMLRVLGEKQQDTYGARLESLARAAQGAKSDIARVNKIAEMSKSIKTNVQGLGAIVQTNAIMSAQLSGLHQAVVASATAGTEVAKVLAEEKNEQDMKQKRRQKFNESLFGPVGKQ